MWLYSSQEKKQFHTDLLYPSPKPLPEQPVYLQESRWQESEAARGKFHRINRQKCYCQNPRNATTAFQECFVLPVNKVRQKAKKNNCCPKAIISFSERHLKHPNMKWNSWCYHSWRKRILFPDDSLSFNPFVLCSAFHFFSSPMHTANLISRVDTVKSNIFNHLAFFLKKTGTLDKNPKTNQLEKQPLAVKSVDKKVPFFPHRGTAE